MTGIYLFSALACLYPIFRKYDIPVHSCPTAALLPPEKACRGDTDLECSSVMPHPNSIAVGCRASEQISMDVTRCIPYSLGYTTSVAMGRSWRSSSTLAI